MWYPFSDFDRAVSSFTQALARPQRHSRPVAEPATSLSETDTAYEFRIDLPGVSAENLDLEVHEQTMTVIARRTIPTREGYSTHRAERRSFEFRRAFTFPVKLDADQVNAELKDGVLTVTLAKAPQPKPRRVAISIQ